MIFLLFFGKTCKETGVIPMIIENLLIMMKNLSERRVKRLLFVRYCFIINTILAGRDKAWVN